MTRPFQESHGKLLHRATPDLDVVIQALLQAAHALDIHANLVELLLTFTGVVDATTDDLLHKGAAHHRLDGRRLTSAGQMLVNKVLHTTMN